MKKPIISVGMATHRDFHGTYFTIQELKVKNPQLLRQMQIVIVDQGPDTPEGQEVKKLAGWTAQCCHSVKYIPYTERIGTSASRQRVIEECDADIFAVVDCHVGLLKNALPATLEYLSNPLHAKDIVSGPLLNDAIYLRLEEEDAKYDPENGPFGVMATHYADHWRAEMWGTWSNAWQCSCGGFNFATWKEDELVRYETITMRPQFVKHCQACGKRFPLLGWSGHEQQLREAGYIELAQTKKPFEISGQGLGFFAMRRESWPGFAKETWGFGGEELWIHEKVRINGGKAVCLPDAKWYHRFPRPEKSTYPNTNWYKARNYVVEFKELAWDLTPIKEHFVDRGIVHPTEWEKMSNEPEKFIHGPTDSHQQPLMVNGNPVATIKVTADGIYEKFRGLKRDLNQHMAVLREITSSCESICEFSKRRESAAIWAVCGAEKLELHNLELGDQDLQAALGTVKDRLTILADTKQGTQVETIEECDALFIDSVHHGDRLRMELHKFGQKAKKYIICRGTGNFGNQAEGTGEGLFPPIREFVFDNPEWFVMYHTNQQYGITVLTCLEENRPPKPIIPWPPGFGPGTELHAINKDLGIKQVPGCGCIQLQNRMDLLGPDGCEKHFDSLVEEMRKKSPGWGWTYVGAVYKALTTGLLYKGVSPLDPIPGLLKLAIANERKRLVETAATLEEVAQ